MDDHAPHTAYSDGDVDTNRSNNPTLEGLIAARYSRRRTLLGGLSAATVAVFGGGILAACGDEDNEAPTVSAGQNAQTSSGRVVTLAGTASDADGVLSSSWTQISGPDVTLSDPNAPTVTFLAPSVAASTPLAFRYTAQDYRGSSSSAETTVTVTPAQLGFTAVAKNKNDVVTVPEGYSVTVLYRVGDPLAPSVPVYANDGTDTAMGARIGDHGDALYYYGLSADGNARSDSSSTRGLLVQNFENINQQYLHPAGATSASGTRPESEALKEIEAHGVAVVEVSASSTGAWGYNQASRYNRRITPNTPIELSGPVRGSAFVRTAYAPDGTRARGTINNCANGHTPWASYLTCEENWAGYFRRPASDNAVRSAVGGLTAKSVAGMTRYGVTSSAGNYSWSTVQPADPSSTLFRRWDARVDPAAPADGTGDFRFEPNQFGWVVEIDPFDPASTPRKRTALGRFGHEGAWPGLFVSGRRPAIYMGDDARGEYLYKFVSATAWNPADGAESVTNRLAIGDKYLDQGTLYVARFNEDGSGEWLPLVFGQGPLTAANPTYAFADQADVLVNTRLAADAAGATRMDRPEWTAVNPVNGEMYLTLTNNNLANRPPNRTNAANPRSYNDPAIVTPDEDQDPQATRAQEGNPNGHIVRLRETGDSTEATSFRWDIYVFGAGADLDPTNINISRLDATNDFSSPDGLWFGRPSNASGLVTPVLWIQTDDGAYTDVTNNQMLAAMPGTVGDGGPVTIANMTSTGTGTQSTLVGRAPGTMLRRFLVGPNECEITGIDSTPDGRVLFVGIQHPGEEGAPDAPTSSWPATQATGTAPAGTRPRSGTIVITKNDGGVVAL